MADLRGKVGGTCADLGVQILSISCIFWEKFSKLYVGALLWGVGTSPLGNPGSATGNGTKTFTGTRLEIPQHAIIFKANCCLKFHNVLLKVFLPILGYTDLIASRMELHP